MSPKLKHLIATALIIGAPGYTLLLVLFHLGLLSQPEAILSAGLILFGAAVISFRPLGHLRRLRKAMNLPDTDDLIRAVRSAGYALDLKDEYT